MGIAPDWRAISLPLWRSISVGMERMPKRSASPRSTSVLSLASRSAGSSWAVAAENAGAICRHGPHHGAQKSTSKGTSERSARARKFSAVRTAGRPSRSAMRQRPHLASADIRASGRRFVAPHAAQPTIFVPLFDSEILAAVSRSLARHALLVTGGLPRLAEEHSPGRSNRSPGRKLSQEAYERRLLPKEVSQRASDLLENPRWTSRVSGKLLCV